MIFLVAGCFLVLAGVIAWQARSADKERQAFAQERREWAAEREQLNTRIQAPEAAPFMFEEDAETREDDLPTLPEITMSDEELEQAKKALEEVGYSSGPVA